MEGDSAAVRGVEGEGEEEEERPLLFPGGVAMGINGASGVFVDCLCNNVNNGKLETNNNIHTRVFTDPASSSSLSSSSNTKTSSFVLSFAYHQGLRLLIIIIIND